MPKAFMQVAESPERRRSEAEKEIERLSRLSPEELSAEDLYHLTKLRDLRASLVEGENELAEVKERVKLRKKALETATREACTYTDNRGLAGQMRLGL